MDESRARLVVIRAHEACDASDCESMSEAVRAMVAVHAFGAKLTPAHLGRLRLGLGRSGSLRYYSAGSAFAVSGAELEALTPRASAMVLTALWYADWKWVVRAGNKAIGAETAVHFGYHGAYGGKRRLADLRSMRLRGAELTYRVARKKGSAAAAAASDHRTTIASIEVPNCASCYLMVNAAKRSSRSPRRSP